jgi:DNA replication protein DnaC
MMAMKRRIDGHLILSHRLRKGLTQQQVADRVGIGLRTYRRYERADFANSGHGTSRLECHRILAYIAQFFDVPVEELLAAPELEPPATGSAPIASAGLDPRLVIEKWDDTADVQFDRRAFEELCSLRFVQERRNVLFLGPVGVGKTFLASALGHIGACAGLSVGFVRARALLAQLVHDGARDLVEPPTPIANVDLLILDDFAIERLGLEETRAMCRLFLDRDGRFSTCITSSRLPAEWFTSDDTLFTDSVIDRFVNNAHEIGMRGVSYRPRLKPRPPIVGQRTVA